jgi:uncharacterized membrane protein
MGKHRLEALFDGANAIILTIMVLDLKVPEAHSCEALDCAWPVSGADALSDGNAVLT